MAGFFTLKVNGVSHGFKGYAKPDGGCSQTFKPLLVIGFLAFVVYDYIKIHIINQGNVH